MHINKCILIFLIVAISYSCNHQATLFQPLPASETNIDFINQLDTSKSFRVLYFFYYYNGGGVATGDINNDGLTDLYFTANSKGNNKLYLNKGNFKFEDITAKASVTGISDWCTGVTMADINGDGLLDIYVSSVNNIYNFTGHNELYINNGNETFIEKSGEYGLDFSGFSTQASFFDYDHDGDLDCYILNQSQKPAEHLFDTSYRRTYDEYAGDRFYRNDVNTTRKFTDVSKEAGIYQSAIGYGLGIAVADFNNDGWNDIYVGNDFHENDYYYLNNGNGTFTESSAEHFNHFSRFSMGNDASDFNNDGNIDIITADMLPNNEKILKTYGSGESLNMYNSIITKNGYQNQYSKNCLQRNNGNGKSFSEVSLINGVAATDWSWSPLFADFDNDGNKDLFISSGIPKRTVDMDYIKFISNIYVPPNTDAKEKYNEALQKIPDGACYNSVFKGNGNSRFEDVSKSWGIQNKKGYYNAAAYADFDNDGDLDIVVNPVNQQAFIYRNNLTNKNYLQIKFNGQVLNKFGVGAKAYIFQNGKIQYQQLMPTRGFQSSSFYRLNFGLDTTHTIDSLLIVWSSQKFQLIKNPLINTSLEVDEKNASGKFMYTNFFPPKKESLIPLPSLLDTPWGHKEDNFDDFSVQFLMPHQLSKRGPKIAVADINKDGLDDFYVCGSMAQYGKLFMQNQRGKFIDGDSSAFKSDAGYEDADAVFFDVDNDGDKDLYVVSGGNFYSGSDIHLTDRLYINNGKGNFTKSINKLPQFYSNKSCVSIADIDNDGDKDIFVGTLTDAKAYGIPQTSYLLLNDGKGNFSIADKKFINLKNIGMITSSAFTDINKDGRKDLIIAGEWMPLTIFINNGKTFSKHTIDSSNGLWQCLQMTDLNSDGNIDILAGNWGLNTKLATGKNMPLKLYVKDFDNTGKQQSLMAYNINGTEYPFLPKDDIEQSLPAIKNAFLYYTDFAGTPIQQLFNKFSENVLELHADDLASAAFINNGKDNFTKIDLPPDLQLTPLFSFLPLNYDNFYLAGGNFFGVLPYEGSYDAASLSLFQLNNMNNVLKTKVEILDTKQQVRDVKLLHTKNGEVIIVAKNNSAPEFYKINK